MKQNLTYPVKKYWYLLAGNVILSFLLTQIVIDGSNRIAKATDQLFHGEEIIIMELLKPFLLLTLAGTVTAFLATWFKNQYSIQIQTEIKNITVEKLVVLPYSYFDQTGSGSIMNKLISDIYQVEGLFSEVMPQILTALITIITICIYIAFIDIRLCLVTVISYPLLLGFANKFSKMMGKLTGNRRELYDQMEETALDHFNGMIVGRSYNLDHELQKQSDHVVDSILNNEFVRTRINSFSQMLGNVIRWLPSVICYLFALFEIMHGYMSIGMMISFTILLNRIIHPFSEMPSLFNALREQFVSFNRINDIVKQQEEPSGDGHFKAEKDVPAIKLSNIHFGYDEERVIFDDFNLTIPQGQNIALVGSSGGGKSTVFKLICGFYRADQGSYELFGHNYQDWDIKELRKQTALVSQNVFLFPGTIAENIAYGRKGATKEDIINACKNANIHDFINGLPDGYDTMVGERGVKLSGGQRQRISIARAFLKQAPILMLDEPTSAVDVETEELIKDAIRKISAGKTVITIAHRLSTIENADQIFVFNDGKIAEHGTHEELLHADGLYQQLYSQENLLTNEMNAEKEEK